jgi:FkbM family methyltransferase
MKIPNVLASSDYGPIIVNVNDAIIGRLVMDRGFSAADDIELIRLLLDVILQRKQSVLFYDVGANIGTHTLALAKIYGERIRIRAFEAQRQIFYMLCGTVALNGLSNVYCHNMAVGDQSGGRIEVQLPNYQVRNNFGSFELVRAEKSDNHLMIKGEQSEFVDLTTMDFYSEHVDFIKLDVEGMESSAIRGGLATISRCRPVCMIEILKSDLEPIVGEFRRLEYCGFQRGGDLILIPLDFGVQISGLIRLF